MKNLKETLRLEVASITCDCCKRTYDDEIEMAEFLSYRDRCGYGADQTITQAWGYGDGDLITVDLCQYCKSQLLGEYIQIDQESNPFR